MCETLYYHCRESRKFVDELNRDLVESGAKLKGEEKEVRLREEFKSSNFYKEGFILLNEQTSRNREVNKAIEEGLYAFPVVETAEIRIDDVKDKHNGVQNRRFRAKELGYPVLRTAVQCTQGFTYDYLKKIYCEEQRPCSMRKFVEAVLYERSINLEGCTQDLSEMSQEKKLGHARRFVQRVKEVIDKKSQQKKGTVFTRKEKGYIRNIFKNKTIHTNKELFSCSGDHYAYENLYLTSEEQSFARDLNGRVAELKKKYKEIYLLRNEGAFEIFDFEDGRPFEPDFVLFMRKKDDDVPLLCQFFIEPKGGHLADGERWKEEFLQAMEAHEGKEKQRTFEFNEENTQVRLVGLPFYNKDSAQDFWDTFHKKL